jgi:hypothetical protein
LLASQRCIPALYAERSSLTAEPLRAAAAATSYLPSPPMPVTGDAAGPSAEPSVAAVAFAGFASCYGAADGE